MTGIRVPQVGDIIVLEHAYRPDVVALGVVVDTGSRRVTQIRLLGGNDAGPVADFASVYRISVVPSSDLDLSALEAHPASSGTFTSWGAALEFLFRPGFRRETVTP